MRRLLAISLFLPLVCLAVSAQRGASQQTIDVTVNVRLDKGPPPGQVKVELLSWSGVPIGVAFTDERGIATLSHVKPGADYVLRVSAEGVDTATQNFEIQSIERTHTEWVMLQRTQAQKDSLPGGTVLASDLNVPGDARKEFEKGGKLAAGNDWRGAAPHFEKAIALYPRYARAYHALAIVRIEMGDRVGGREALEHALAIDDKYPEANLDLGKLLFLQGDNAGAEKNFSAAVAVVPTDVEALTMLATVQLQLGELDGAIANAQKVHALPHPGKAVVHFIAGTSFAMQHKDTEAMAEYGLYLQEDPNGYFGERSRSALAQLHAK